MSGDGVEGPGPVEVAVRGELERMGAEVAGSARGAMAVDLARRQDGAHTAGQAAQVARQLLEVLTQLRANHPPQAEADGLDELRKRREQREQRGAS